MSGLIRGKPLVWVRDGMYIDCWSAECQFGVYFAWNDGSKFRWRLRSFDTRRTINEGDSDTLERAQSACQADHDQRAMASVEVVPFEWLNDSVKAGPLSLVVLNQPNGWMWRVQYGKQSLLVATARDRDAAITAAEQFVRQLVMGVQS